MTLYVRSYSFSDPNFSDTPVVENDEGTRTFQDQVRSAGQQYIAVIIKEITDTENTVVKVIKKDATELYEVVINKSAKLWDVNDNGEVLLYTETISNGSTVRELICLDNTGSVKWSVDLGGTTPNAIEIGTDYAGIVAGSNVRFFSVADGSEVNAYDTGYQFEQNRDQQCYGSADGSTLAYRHSTNCVVFANVDGDFTKVCVPGEGIYLTGRDIHCGRVSTHIGYVLFRTGEVVGRTGGDYVIISPCGEWLVRAASGKVQLYYVTTSELKYIKDVNYASGVSGEKSIDLSFYGKYALVLHGNNILCVYDMKAEMAKDTLDNPLGTRAVMLCSD